MAYVTDRKCYINDKLYEAGDTIPDQPKGFKKPEWMTLVKPEKLPTRQVTKKQTKAEPSDGETVKL